VKRAKTRATRRSQILRKGSAPVLKNDGAEAWDLGDGVLGVTFKTKANSIDPDVISMLLLRPRGRGREGLPKAWSSPTRASTSAWARTSSSSSWPRSRASGSSSARW
jgi:hypothetical protein